MLLLNLDSSAALGSDLSDLHLYKEKQKQNLIKILQNRKNKPSHKYKLHEINIFMLVIFFKLKDMSFLEEGGGMFLSMSINYYNNMDKSMTWVI